MGAATLLSYGTLASSQVPPRFDLPANLVVADPSPVRLSGLTPRTLVDIVSTRASDAPDHAYVAHARFRSDAHGRIDLSRDAPVDGDYAGVDKAGLFWSAHLVPMATADGVAQGFVRLDVVVDGLVTASTLVRIAESPRDLSTEAVAAFPGAVLVRPAAAGRYPVLIVLGGSEGGASTARAFAPLFAANGYAVLGLPYYSPGYDPSAVVAGLPTSFTEIPVDRLAAVRDWLATRADVDARRIGIWGASKGAEFALIAASHYDWIRAVVAVVPSDVVWEGWGREGPATASFALAGKALPFVPYVGMAEEFAKAQRGEAMEMRRPHVAGRQAHPEAVAAARIPVERYRGPLLLVAGEEDRIWPSADMARAIVATRQSAGLETRAIIAAHAGHALGGTGYVPAAPYVALGGTVEGVGTTREQAWRQTMALFDRALRPYPTTPGAP